jgi:cytosine/adenosine deaminase-related metal-dependent hydrolase
MPTLLAKNADVLVTMHCQRRELEGAGLYAENGIIKQIGRNEELPATAETTIDLSGQIARPDFVNAHHHLNQTLVRDLPATPIQGQTPLRKRDWTAPVPGSEARSYQ